MLSLLWHNIILEVLARAIQEEKELKYSFGKKNVKLFLVVDDMSIYIKILRNPMKLIKNNK